MKPAEHYEKAEQLLAEYESTLSRAKALGNNIPQATADLFIALAMRDLAEIQVHATLATVKR